jgi:hypothetical protein
MGSLLSLPSLMYAYLTVVGVIALQYFFRRRSVSYLKGPPSPSWLVGRYFRGNFMMPMDSYVAGNAWDMINEESVGDLQFKWFQEYGSVYLTKGCFGVS